MNRMIDGMFHLFEATMVALLAGMTFMVLGNVVLRYLFESGIDLSEELSRFCFVWLTFIGAVAVARKNMHLGVETMVAWLGRRGRLVCLVLSDLLVIVCCAVFFWGTWQQADINATFAAPVSGISMLWVYGIGFLASVGIGLIAVARLLRIAAGRLDPRELDEFAGIHPADGTSVRERLE
jgi:TRAP-type C4-dicarboxylate transport system permease small subunit